MRSTDSVRITAFGCTLLLCGLMLASCSMGGAESDGDGSDGSDRGSAERSVDSGDLPLDGSLEKVSAVKVQTAPLVRREMVRAISTVANAESVREIAVSPRTAGIVTKIRVEEGDSVEEGEELMYLDPRELQAVLDEALIAKREAEDANAGLDLAVNEAEAQVRRAELQFSQAKRELERKENVGGDLVSRNELDQLRLTVETNEADVAAQKIALERAKTAVTSQKIAIEKAALQIKTAELNLSFATVKAPWKGIITKRDVRTGDLVSNATVAFTLTDAERVQVIVTRPQREYAIFAAAERIVAAQAKAGAQKSSGTEDDLGARGADGGDADALDIVMRPEALPGFEYKGQFLRKSQTIDPASGQFGVTLKVVQPGEDDKRPRVLPGMLMRVRIITERHLDALVVPKRALVREGDSFFVFAIEDDRARRIRVTEGFADTNEVEIFPAEGETIEPGADIVVVGNRDLDAGDTVEATVWPPFADEATGASSDDAEDEAAEQPDATDEATDAVPTDAVPTDAVPADHGPADAEAETPANDTPPSESPAAETPAPESSNGQ